MKRSSIAVISFIGISFLIGILAWLKLPVDLRDKVAQRLDLVYLLNNAVFNLRDTIGYRGNIESVDIVRSGWHVLRLKTVDARSYLTNGCRETGYGHNRTLCNAEQYQFLGIPGGYIEELQNGLVLGINGLGHMFTYDIKKESLSPLNSNLHHIFTVQDYKGKVQKNLAGRFGFKGFFYDQKDRFLYASLFVNNGHSCYGMALVRSKNRWTTQEILKAQTNGSKVMFEEFYRTKDCNTNFNGHAGGGRIARMGDRLLFALGFLDKHTDSSGNTIVDPTTGFVPTIPFESEAGKLLSISLTNKDDVDTFSSGHRNPQGLHIHGNIVVLSEHGPFGGDEINIIQRGKDYGWPKYAYAYDYDYKAKFIDPDLGTSQKPLYYFTPSIGISEIMYYTGDMFPRWKNKLLVSSLKENSLFILHTDKQSGGVMSAEKINIGARLRDMLLLKDGSILLVTDSQVLKHLTAAPSYTKNYYPLSR
jgi:hypothetical protein